MRNSLQVLIVIRRRWVFIPCASSNVVSQSTAQPHIGTHVTGLDASFVMHSH